MKCPKCDKEMGVEIVDVTNKIKKDKEYARTLYWCKSCDVYIGVYVPKL